MWVTDIFKIKFPMRVRLIGQILWFARDCVYLTACLANLIDDVLIDVAP